MYSRCRILALLILALALPGLAQQAFQRNWNADELFGAGTSSHMVLRNGSIMLDDAILIEDDAPACGYSANPSAVEIIKEGVILKKLLVVDRLPVRGAWVVAMVYPDNPPNPNNGRHLLFTVNGHEISYEVKHFWTRAEIPAGVLRIGENEILVRALEADTRFKTWIALEENFKIGSSTRMHHPNRSLRSTDGGKTWDSQHLGINGKADGEYSIRLALKGYQNEGWIESPVIDAAENLGQGLLQVPVQFKKIVIDVKQEVPTGAKMILETRSGPMVSPESGGWSSWGPSSGELAPDAIKGRFLQFRLRATTSDPAVSPTINGAQVRSEYAPSSEQNLTEYHVNSATNSPARPQLLYFRL